MSYVEQYPVWGYSDQVPEWVAAGAAPSFSAILEVFHDPLEMTDEERHADMRVLAVRIIMATPGVAVATQILGTRRVGVRMQVPSPDWEVAATATTQALDIMRGWRPEAQVARIEIMPTDITH